MVVLPLLASKQCLGVVGLKFPSAMNMLSVEQKRLAETMIEYIAQAISRTQLSKRIEIANVTSETEKLRSALLSISTTRFTFTFGFHDWSHRDFNALSTCDG